LVKIVYVLRNPKDMLVSTYKFLQSSELDKYTGSFEDFFKMFVEGQMWYGTWWDHVNQYTSLENVHVIHYENLIEVVEIFGFLVS
jgi:aryl sulfotransferase